MKIQKSFKYGSSWELIKVTRVLFGKEYCDASRHQRENMLKLTYHHMSDKYHTQVMKTLEASVLRWSKDTQKHNEDIHI